MVAPTASTSRPPKLVSSSKVWNPVSVTSASSAWRRGRLERSYDTDPRADPEAFAHPVAVFASGGLVSQATAGQPVAAASA